VRSLLPPLPHCCSFSIYQFFPSPLQRNRRDRRTFDAEFPSADERDGDEFESSSFLADESSDDADDAALLSRSIADRKLRNLHQNVHGTSSVADQTRVTGTRSTAPRMTAPASRLHLTTNPSSGLRTGLLSGGKFLFFVQACLWPRCAASLRGASASALGIGLLNAVSQFSGLLGPQLWRSDYGPRYYNSSKAACAFVSAAFLFVCAAWYLMESNLSWSPWLKRHVLAQTQVTEEDEAARARGETAGHGAKLKN
jgi:hypothetical protein